MVKLDYERDYYADLELASTASVADIKTQFKKLALKWHPDRNHGREEEAKTRFVIIQSAQEVLLDPVKKAKYDSERKSRLNRYPMASGKKGNPYADVASHFPRPPQRASQRPPMPSRPATSGAARYSSWTQPQPEFKGYRASESDNMRAWDRMRPSSSSKQTPQPSAQSNASAPGASPQKAKSAAPPPPPRTQSQRQKQEASFGTRRAGFVPASPMGDERPVSSKFYNTTKTHTNIFEDVPRAPSTSQSTSSSDHADPLSQMFSETLTRTQRPYTSHPGEKFNLFEGVARANSTKEGVRRTKDNGADASTTSSRRSRRASDGESEASKSPTRQKTTGAATGKPSFVFTQADDQDKRQAKSGSDRAPKSAPASDTFAANPATFGARTTNTNGGFSKPQNGHSVYGSHFNSPSPSMTPQVRYNSGSSSLPMSSRLSGHGVRARRHEASNNGSPATDGFSFPIDDDTFQPTTSDHMKNRPETINAQFVPGQNSSVNFQFNAGGTMSEDDSFSRAKRSALRSRMKTHRSESPLKRGGTFRHDTMNPSPQGPSEKKAGGFNADQWSAQIGPENFVPPRPSVSPSRSGRVMKKPRGVKMTAGTAGLVDEDETSSEEKATASAAYSEPISGSRSPNAMDIDTPPPEPVAQQPASVRNIPVEPSRPEWRAGNLSDKEKSKPVKDAKPTPFQATVGGSEDSDEFLQSKNGAFADFGSALRVGPFGPSKAGLSSLSDIKNTLPFESRASAKIHVGTDEAKPFKLPTSPTRPVPPVAIGANMLVNEPTWNKYAQDFNRYMAEWVIFNSLYVGYFSSNQQDLLGTRDQNGSFPWVQESGDDGLKKYLARLEEEKMVRRHWDAAKSQHESIVREFAGYRSTYRHRK